MNIYEKMLAITSDLSAVAKNLTVGEGRSSYKAVGEADVLAAVKPLEAKYGIYSYPCSRRIVETNVMTTTQSYNGNSKEVNKLFMRLETIYRFVNVEKPEEFIEITSYGDGVDTQDKATGKAMTYSDKYALLKAYKIITGEDPDQTYSESGKFADPKKGESEPLATDREKRVLIERCKQLGVDINDILRQVGVTGKMTAEQHGKALLILKEIEEEKS